MIAIIVIICTPNMLHNYSFFLVVEIKFWSLGKFDDCNTILLSICTVLCITSLGLILLLIASSYP